MSVSLTLPAMVVGQPETQQDSTASSVNEPVYMCNRTLPSELSMPGVGHGVGSQQNHSSGSTADAINVKHSKLLQYYALPTCCALPVATNSEIHSRAGKEELQQLDSQLDCSLKYKMPMPA
jgi:hypothetical protein